jgi:hypothetical protein
MGHKAKWPVPLQKSPSNHKWTEKLVRRGNQGRLKRAALLLGQPVCRQRHGSLSRANHRCEDTSALSWDFLPVSGTSR